MRLSELSAHTGIPIATIKYYLREELLHPGESLTARQADYDETHAARVRLIRGLVHILGASIDQVRQILTVIDTPGLTPLEAMAQARLVAPVGPQDAPVGPQDAPVGPQDAPVDQQEEGPASSAEHEPAGEDLAREVLYRHDFTYDPTSPYLRELDQALTLAQEAGISIDADQMAVYTAAARQIARADFARIPWQESKQAVQFAVLGTALYEPVLLTLRRIAHDEQGLLRAAQHQTTHPPQERSTR